MLATAYVFVLLQWCSVPLVMLTLDTANFCGEYSNLEILHQVFHTEGQFMAAAVYVEGVGHYMPETSLHIGSYFVMKNTV